MTKKIYKITVLLDDFTTREFMVYSVKNFKDAYPKAKIIGIDLWTPELQHYHDHFQD